MSASPPQGIRTSRKLKVRTGCITCKIRKVKCDEAKPFCKRCGDTGRKCDGYAAPPETKSTKSSTTTDRSVVSVAQKGPSPPTSIQNRAVRRLAPATLIVDADFISPALSGEDSLWVEFFSMRTGPALSSVFSHSFWSFTLPQLSISEPAIRHALIALGSAHARYEADAMNNQVLQAAVRPDFVLWHYTEAIKHLQTRLAGDPQASDVALLCCLMFVSLECLHGNRNLVMDHLKNGLNILRSSQLRDSDTGASSNADSRSIKQEVRSLFHRLDSQTTLMGYPASTLFNHMDKLLTLSTPRSFKDFEHAKDSLDLLVASSLGFIRDIYDGKHADRRCITLSARTLQIHLLSEFTIWNNSMADLVKACTPFTDDDNKVEKSLRVQHTATFIWLSRCTELKQLGFDAFLPEFALIVKWSRILMMPAPEAKDPCLHARLASLSVDGAAKFSLNMAYIPPLYLVAIKCRDPITRREAISILEETNGREGLWDARLHAKVARRLVEIEETGVLIAQGAKSAYMEPGSLMRIIADGEPKMLMTPPDECFRVHDTDLRDISEGFTGTCSAKFSTFGNGMLEESLSWTETIHF